MRFLAYKQSSVCGFKLTKHDHKMVNFQSPPKGYNAWESQWFSLTKNIDWAA